MSPSETSPVRTKVKHEAVSRVQNGVAAQDLLYLARLCQMEAGGMSPAVRDAACLSVVSTALSRTRLNFLSDGTLASTLGWHSGETWQFAGYLVDGCSPTMPYRACPDNHPANIEHFKRLLKQTLSRPDFPANPVVCRNYLFYNSIPGGNVECVITDPKTGQFIEFYKQAPEPTPNPEPFLRRD